MRLTRRNAAFTVLTIGAVGCSIATHRGEVGIYEAPAKNDGAAGAAADGSAAGASDGSAGASASEPSPAPVLFLTMLLRDFKIYDPNDPTTNPAFFSMPSERSVVMSQLGADSKPIYKAPANTIPTYGKAFFDQWYHDTPGTNYLVPYPLPLALTDDGQYEYDSQKSGTPDFYLNVHRRIFLPIDDGTPYATPFGNQRRQHNFDFTGELHATFALTDAGGSVQVRADDDIYVFVDGKLVIDLGGTHGPVPGEVALGELGLAVPQDYPLDIFYAERQGATGDFMLRTDLELKPRIVPAP